MQESTQLQHKVQNLPASASVAFKYAIRASRALSCTDAFESAMVFLKNGPVQQIRLVSIVRGLNNPIKFIPTENINFNGQKRPKTSVNNDYHKLVYSKSG